MIDNQTFHAALHLAGLGNTPKEEDLADELYDAYATHADSVTPEALAQVVAGLAPILSLIKRLSEPEVSREEFSEILHGAGCTEEGLIDEMYRISHEKGETREEITARANEPAFQQLFGLLALVSVAPGQIG